jgi:hypothetical protein
MSKASRSQAIDPGLMNLIAKRIHRRMQKLGLTHSELSEQCSIAGANLSSSVERPSLSRERISKILMNRHDLPNENAARSLTQLEMNILANVLKVSVEWLRGDGLGKDSVVWNVLAEPQRGAQLLHLLEEYEDLAGESVVWSEHPLCSFTTEAFMTAFHRAHFGEMHNFGITKDRHALVDFFNKAGRARRKRVLRPGRSFSFTGLIYNSEIERIAKGAGVYRNIPTAIRKGAFKHMVNVLADSELKMALVIVNDEKIRRFESRWRDYENFGVMGELFSVWNYHSGSIGWTENLKHVVHHRRLLNEMARQAFCRNAAETVKYLNGIAMSL